MLLYPNSVISTQNAITRKSFARKVENRSLWIWMNAGKNKTTCKLACLNWEPEKLKLVLDARKQLTMRLVTFATDQMMPRQKTKCLSLVWCELTFVGISRGRKKCTVLSFFRASLRQIRIDKFASILNFVFHRIAPFLQQADGKVRDFKVILKGNCQCHDLTGGLFLEVLLSPVLSSAWYKREKCLHWSE